jgi:hypothetical protein
MRRPRPDHDRSRRPGRFLGAGPRDAVPPADGALTMGRKLFALVAIVSVGGLLGAYPRDKDDKKDEKKDGKEVKAKIVKINLDKKVLTVTTEDKKTLDVAIADEVKFIGPRGGVSKEGIKDDRVAVGNEITLTYDAAGKVLKEVHLPYRSNEPKDKDAPPKDKDKVKDKDK